MAITLDDVVLEQMQTNETLVQMHESQDIQILLQGAGIEYQTNILSQMLQLMQTEARLAEEARREAARSATANPFVSDDSSGTNLPTPVSDDSSNLLTAGIFSVTALAAKEFVSGFAGAVKRDFTKIRAREFPKLFKFLNVDLLKPFKDFNAVFSSAVKDLFSKRGTGQFLKQDTYKFFGKYTESARDFVDGIKRLENRVGGFFRALRPDFIFDMIDDIKAAGTRMSDFFNNSRLVQGVRSIFSGTGMTRFMSALGGFFNLLGRIAYPLLLGWEVLTGAKKEVEAMGPEAGMVEKTLAALVGAGKGVIRFVFGFFDLIKDISSWVAEKLGFFDFSRFLDSFSFADGAVDIFFGSAERFGQDISKTLGLWIFNTVEFFKNIPEYLSAMFDDLGVKIGGLIFDLVEWFKSIPEMIGDVWNSLPSLSDVGNIVSNGVRSLVRSILPPADFVKFEVPKFETWAGTVGGGSINLNPIPDSVYEWANATPPSIETGASIEGGASSSGEPIVVDPPAIAEKLASAETSLPQVETASEIAEKLRNSAGQNDQGVLGTASKPELAAAAVDVIDGVIDSTNREARLTRIDGGDGSVFDRLAAKIQATFGDDLNSGSIEAVAAATATPPIIIQDNSVNSSNQSNLSQSVSTGSGRSPVNDNRTRASAYATT